MTKKLRAIIAVIAAFAVVFFAAVFSYNSDGAASVSASEQFYGDLSEMLHNYDKDLTKEDLKNEYGMARLVVTSWNGKKYGAVDCAYDKSEDIAVLQYSSPEKAKSAAVRMNAEGMQASPDTPVYLDSAEKCTMSPNDSNALGVNSYLDNFEMVQDNVVVAVIDTGVMFDHSDLEGRFTSQGIDLSGDNMTNAYYDVDETGEHYGHGTSVCGIIADNTPDKVKILPIKVVPFGIDYATSSSISAAINYAVDYGAKVISISVSGAGYVNSYQKVMNNALSKGVCICASAGNSSEEITERYPACLDGVITASALDGTYSQIASYSNYGDVIDFCAPGYKINSTFPLNGESSYKAVSGTSFSAPFIASLCADIKCVDSSMSKDEVYQTLCDFSVDLGESGRDKYYGNGMPYLGNMQYSGEGYSYSIPQGTLSLASIPDYTQENRPWARFATKMTQVNIANSVERVGDYAFYNMRKANFTMPDNFKSVGDYSFFCCRNLSEISFGIDVEGIGYKAFANTNDLTINGYGNTPAESYAASQNIRFNSLGCNHDYFREAFTPEGEEPYILCTCYVCGDTSREKYKAPLPVLRGTCGYGVNYTLDALGRLKIYGTGAMFDYSSREAPWYGKRDEIKILEITSGVYSVSPYAFYGCDSIIKVYAANDSEYFSSDEVSLMNKAGNELILTFAHTYYVLPSGIDTLSATAFIAAGNIALHGNGNFTVENSLIYDKNGNIVAALPDYRERTLTINKQIEIKPYAFILCEYPQRLESDIVDLTVGEYALGYVFNGAITKHSFTVSACAENGAMLYAQSNGFDTEISSFKCGDNMTYSYDENSNTLKLSGMGDMYVYSSAESIPWYGIIPDITTLEIGDGVLSVSPYSFSGADGLYYLTMPLSLKAPEDETTWSGCEAIKYLTLTLGTGVMDDYDAVNGEEIYRLTPWFLSKATIKEFSIDSRVRYIGKTAFRGFSAISELKLDCIEEIGEDAFLACAKLKAVTIYSKDAVLPDYCILSYKATTKKLYPRVTVTAYCDSTAKDYCTRLGATLIPLGCGHSRDITLLGEESDDAHISKTYYCADCGEEFTETQYINASLSGTVKTAAGVPVSNASVTIAGVTALTNGSGEYTLPDEIPCGNAEISVSVNGVRVYSDSVHISPEITTADITFSYADYIPDGVINAKDYAFALKNGFNGKELFDYGRINAADNHTELKADEN